MGREYHGKRQYVHLCSACLTVIFLFGCVPLRELNYRHIASSHFLRGQQLAAEGDFSGAVEENRMILSLPSGSTYGDRALYSMGPINARSDNPGQDYRASLSCFEQLLREYPRSALRDESKIWAGILQDMVETKKRDEEMGGGQFTEGQRFLVRGRFKESLKELEDIVNAGDTSSDRALFLMGLIHAHYDNPDKDYRMSAAYFEKLLKQYPQSPLFEQAKILRNLLDMIEKAKQVDIEIEKTKKEYTQ